MKIAEMLIFCANFPELLYKCNIKTNDFRYLPMYQEYKESVARGEKVSATVVLLAKKYKCSERFVYKYVKKMEQDCNICAVCNEGES